MRPDLIGQRLLLKEFLDCVFSSGQEAAGVLPVVQIRRACEHASTGSVQSLVAVSDCLGLAGRLHCVGNVVMPAVARLAVHEEESGPKDAQA